MKKKSQKVFVALSGGVDSAVAAYLLKERGCDVRGIFMREFDYADIDPKSLAMLSCAQKDDLESARAVADALGIPFEAWDFRKEYYKHVVKYLYAGYRKGVTPNPDVMCNSFVKFGAFLDQARRRGADSIATGHYVKMFTVHGTRYTGRKQKKISQYGLKIAKDTDKDQSYFLYTLTQEQLANCVFPLGNLLKSEVRSIAKKAGLPNWNRKDSQGICFVGKIPMKDFLSQSVSGKKGTLLATDGRSVGTHSGVQYVTIGQRHGLGFAGGARPYYVVGKDIKKNIIYVGHDDDPALYAKELECDHVYWIAGAPRLNEPLRARIRYRQPLQSCRIIKSHKKNIFRVVFRFKQRAIAPGQAIVFYKGDAMLGGGAIMKHTTE